MRRIAFRAWSVVLVAILLTVAFGSGEGANASGNPACPHGNNYISMACFYGVIQSANSANWRNMQMNVSSSYLPQGGHINETMLAYTGSPCTDWVEEGFTDGFNGYAGYYYYVAYQQGSTYNQYGVSTAVADTSNHNYLIASSGGNSWQVYRDGALQYSRYMSSSNICVSQAGLEAQKLPLSGYYANTFDATPLQWRDTSNIWHTGWNTSQEWIDFPCGSSPNCFNGVFYGSSQWSANKP